MAFLLLPVAAASLFPSVFLLRPLLPDFFQHPSLPVLLRPLQPRPRHSIFITPS
ncbi:hypothetical protein E2C01_095563 [Portunus trituberculatus]|uniref:Uncharacterized protein n=1 Tax=Portunus trituberculatus TaxID=210409 RepID=A0A5B7JQ56_PORTR|nr:hypothetical protein [Portunus trituberculatus]